MPEEHDTRQRRTRRRQAAEARRLDVDCLPVVVGPRPSHFRPQLKDHDRQQWVMAGEQSSRERHQTSPLGLADPKEVASAGVELGLGGDPPELRDESVADVDDRLLVRVDHLHRRRVRDQLNVGPLRVGEHSVAVGLTDQSLSEGVQSEQGTRMKARRTESARVDVDATTWSGVAKAHNSVELTLSPMYSSTS